MKINMKKLYNQSIKEADPEVYKTLEKELTRQQNQIEFDIFMKNQWPNKYG